MTSRLEMNPIDVHVGERLRHHRCRLGWSQDALARAMAVSFQQIQKYERGLNRLSASKLYAAAAALQIKPDDFFEGLPMASETTVPKAVAALLADEEGANVAERLALLSASRRRKILSILKLLATLSPQPSELKSK